MDPSPYPGPMMAPGPTIAPVPGPTMDPGPIYEAEPNMQPTPGSNIKTAQLVSYNYAAQSQTVQPVMVVMQPTPTDCPGQMLCPHCQNHVVTVIEHKIGALTWLICGVLGLFLCWPCCWIPFVVDACKDVEHHCPLCHNVLYRHKRL